MSACGTVANSRKIDYRNIPVLPPLEVPPDLSAAPDANAGAAATAPPAATTYSGYTDEQKAATPAGRVVLPRYPGVRLARDGQTLYVVVDAEPAAVWDQVKEFLNRTGLTIASENSRVGLLETNWAENRALVGGSDSNFLSKWIGGFFSVGMRDKYHVRFERAAAPGTTEIYISHRGMEELEPVPSPLGGASRGWKPRPSDPELEAEMLHRLVAYLGIERAPNQVATNAPAPAAAPPSARLTRNGSGAALLTLEDSLDRAWRRVGLSLDRIGFTVEDRDRSKGVYYVRYIDPETATKEKGLFARLFGSDAPPPSQYQVHVKPVEKGSSVEVLDKEGSPEASKIGERILSLLYEQLK
jgi:outer membrane protein assembly factor BamC